MSGGSRSEPPIGTPIDSRNVAPDGTRSQTAIGTPAEPAVRPRGRAATEERILGAVGEVLARDGFGGIGVNAIARQAGVDKVLIYRYFGGLPELLHAWGASGRFWPRVADLLGPDPQALLDLPAAERYARFFEHFIDELRARPLTVAVLAGEVNERNELTAILEAEREQWGEEAARVLAGAEWAERPWLQGVTLLLVAGVQHLLVRSRQIRVFGGVDLRSDEGWGELKRSLRALAGALFPAAGELARREPASS
jgi:AcrR family transcriptional regulator